MQSKDHSIGTKTEFVELKHSCLPRGKKNLESFVSFSRGKQVFIFIYEHTNQAL